MSNLMPSVATSKIDRINLGDNDAFTPDPLGWYILISPTPKTTEEGRPVFGLSWMRAKDDAPGTPIIMGTARACYKGLAEGNFLAPDHLAYIAYELGRAEICVLNGIEYIQS